jgi:HEPN domain-containing protein
MSLEAHISGSAVDWLRYAESDLEIARINQSSLILLEGLCFHAQQAAEKALKAVLIAHAIPFPRTHNLATLLDLLPQDLLLPSEVEAAAILTDYAVLTRYPGNLEPVTEEEYHEAVRLAEVVVHWAGAFIRSRGITKE